MQILWLPFSMSAHYGWCNKHSTFNTRNIINFCPPKRGLHKEGICMRVKNVRYYFWNMCAHTFVSLHFVCGLHKSKILCKSDNVIWLPHCNMMLQHALWTLCINMIIAYIAAYLLLQRFSVICLFLIIFVIFVHLLLLPLE